MILKALLAAPVMLVCSASLALARCPPGWGGPTPPGGGAVPAPETGMGLGMMLVAGVIYLAHRRGRRTAQVATPA